MKTKSNSYEDRMRQLARECFLDMGPEAEDMKVSDPAAYRKMAESYLLMRGIMPKNFSAAKASANIRKLYDAQVAKLAKIKEDSAGKPKLKAKQEKQVEICVSKSTYTLLAKKAKRAKMDVPAHLEKLAGE